MNENNQQLDPIKWACPKCNATSEGREHSGGKGRCDTRSDDCMGFICECDNDEEHGTSFETPCTYARCYHCGWVGTFPIAPEGPRGLGEESLGGRLGPTACTKEGAEAMKKPPPQKDILEATNELVEALFGKGAYVAISRVPSGRYNDWIVRAYYSGGQDTDAFWALRNKDKPTRAMDAYQAFYESLRERCREKIEELRRHVP